MKKNTIHNEDCFDTLKKMKDSSVDYTITSPPYNRKQNDKYDHFNDRISDTEYEDFLYRVINELMRVTKNTVFFNIQTMQGNRAIVYRLIGRFADDMQNIIVWEKNNPQPTGSGRRGLRNSYELFLCLSKDKSPLLPFSHYTKNIFSTDIYTANPYRKQHRAVMHPEAVDWILKSFVSKSSLVYDPFMGMGTTAERCLLYGCDYIGSELSEEYVRAAEDRLDALLINSSPITEGFENKEEVSLSDILKFPR